MTVSSITSATVGTKLTTAADTKLVSMTIALPVGLADLYTPLVLVDAAAASTTGLIQRVLYSLDMWSMMYLFSIKPSGPSIAPGLTAPTWPQNVFAGAAILFSSGVFVKSCPVNLTFSLTTG